MLFFKINSLLDPVLPIKAMEIFDFINSIIEIKLVLVMILNL